MKGRLQVVEQDNAAQQKELHEHKERLVHAEQEIDQLKQKMAALTTTPRAADNGAPQETDPWMNYIKQRDMKNDGQTRRPGEVQRVARSSFQGRARDGEDAHAQGDVRKPGLEELSEDDKRTLIFGGWCQDTRKMVIEEEAAVLLARDELKNFLDTDKITVFGPRKSFGIIKFEERAGEDYNAVRERMWGVVKFVAALKHKWPSTVTEQDAKPAWASFLKTRGARQRTSHASMLRRLTMRLASETKGEYGAPCHPTSVLQGSFDVDWKAGTTWIGAHKLGSATHRQPPGDDVRLMSNGWVDVRAIMAVTGAGFGDTVAALEREI